MFLRQLTVLRPGRMIAPSHRPSWGLHAPVVGGLVGKVVRYTGSKLLGEELRRMRGARALHDIVRLSKAYFRGRCQRYLPLVQARTASVCEFDRLQSEGLA